MLTARSDSETGDILLLLGLSDENVRRLQAGNPIRLMRASHGLAIPAHLKIVIIAGETEASMAAQLRELGLIGETTVMNQKAPA